MFGHEPKISSRRLRTKGTTIIRVCDDAAEKRNPKWEAHSLKFTPENIQKIKDWVAEGISREEIAKLIEPTVGSLQVTCSRLGISLRTGQNSNLCGPTGGCGRPSPPCKSSADDRHMRVDAQFQISFERGGERRATAVPFTAGESRSSRLRRPCEMSG